MINLADSWLKSLPILDEYLLSLVPSIIKPEARDNTEQAIINQVKDFFPRRICLIDLI
jgi:hypothetical protein